MKPESQIGELGNRQDDIMASRGIFIGFSFLFVFSFFFFYYCGKNRYVSQVTPEIWLFPDKQLQFS